MLSVEGILHQELSKRKGQVCLSPAFIKFDLNMFPDGNVRVDIPLRGISGYQQFGDFGSRVIEKKRASVLLALLYKFNLNM